MKMDEITDLHIEDFDVTVQPGVTRKGLNQLSVLFDLSAEFQHFRITFQSPERSWTLVSSRSRCRRIPLRNVCYWSIWD